MRHVLTLTIGLLAALAASATTASAHDYHRSHRAVEAKYSHPHHKAKRRFHWRAYQRHHPRYRAHRRNSWDRYRSRHVIVISSDGFFRIARRYH